MTRRLRFSVSVRPCDSGASVADIAVVFVREGHRTVGRRFRGRLIYGGSVRSGRMSTADTDEESTVRSALRTVTPLSTEGPNVQMNVFGYLVALPLVLLLLPLLPFVVVWWLGAKGLSALRG